MATTNIRIDHDTYDWLKRRAADQGKPIGAVVSDLIKDRKRQDFRDAVQEDFARLRQDPEAWADYKREFDAWDATLMDGLENKKLHMTRPMMKERDESQAVLAGDIWDATLDPTRGHEQGGFRPVVVVSGNWFNRIADDMVWTIPVTRTDKGFRTHVELATSQGGLTTRSWAMCEQIRAISVGRLKRRRGQVDVPALEQIRAIIRELIID